jgi:hypothetical protein
MTIKRDIPHLPLQLQHTVEQGFRGRRASRYVDIDRYDSVTPSDNRVRVASAETNVRSHKDNRR